MHRFLSSHEKKPLVSVTSISPTSIKVPLDPAHGFVPHVRLSKQFNKALIFAFFDALSYNLCANAPFCIMIHCCGLAKQGNIQIYSLVLESIVYGTRPSGHLLTMSLTISRFLLDSTAFRTRLRLSVSSISPSIISERGNKS